MNERLSEFKTCLLSCVYPLTNIERVILLEDPPSNFDSKIIFNIFCFLKTL